jgi:hypothetical protein
MEPKGLLYVTLLYHEPSVSLQRLPSMRKNGVFGKDLETVTKQEGQNVPVIVKKCIEEVEKRGLEVVGIYRLCASARRKAQLREAVHIFLFIKYNSPVTTCTSDTFSGERSTATAFFSNASLSWAFRLAEAHNL